VLEAHTSISNIMLESSAVKAFPVLLDFMYYSDCALPLSSENAVSFIDFTDLWDGFAWFISKAFELIYLKLHLGSFAIFSSIFWSSRIVYMRKRLCPEGFDF